MAIKVSVALVTRNPKNNLRRTLESIQQQTLQPHEVIISDDSDTDYSEKVKALATSFGCRYIVGPKRGLYANRNQVALACKGTHIRTMDDDHTFEPTHFENCYKAVASDPQAIWTTGEIGYVDGTFYAEVETASQLDPSGFSRPPENMNDNWAIADGSTYYPREVFEKGHRMIEEGYGPSYLEFGILLYAKGYISKCIIGEKVHHYAPKATIDRSKDRSLAQCLGRLRAIEAYNRYFKPNRLLLAKHTLTKMIHCSHPLLLIKELPKARKEMSQRWAQS